jgi:hypothetical protein
MAFHRPGPEYGGRLIFVTDAGTTYGTIGVIYLAPGRDIHEINLSDIQYLDLYPEDICKNTKASNCVPIVVFYDRFPDDQMEWGWSVPSRMEIPEDDVHQWSEHCVAQFKLMLEETEATQEVRRELKVKTDILRGKGFIKDADDVIFHYLRKWFTFARSRGIDKGFARPEFVICAPSGWSVKSYHRWYKAMLRAIREVWDEHTVENPPNISTVVEPEAAASYSMALSDETIKVCLILLFKREPD